jgi:predicted amidophosphoribosyltransferase
VAEALLAVGLGKLVVPCVERIEAVPKSAFAKPGERPNARRHYETMRVNAELIPATRLTLVDDFLTKGNTLLGAATRLEEAYPNAQIAAFGLVRTKGLQLEIEKVIDPCVGEIIRVGDDEADRNP